jgi:pSer/pThr/pTyr-binding forkhead associated (FHA) protein
VQRHTLKDGDEILIGKYQILYSDDKLGERPPSTDNGEKPGKDTVAGPAIEGSLNTMETNSDQIRKRMEEMQKQKSGESATAQETVVTRTGPSPALIVAAIIGLLVLAFLALVLM